MDPLDLGSLTGFLLRRSQQAHVAAWQREVSVEITSVQFGVLNVLHGQPGASQRELCDALDLDRSTIADIVARLQRRGLLHRARDAADKRRNVLELTERGRAEFEALVPGVRRVDAVLTAALDHEARQDLRRILRTLLDSAQVRDAVGREGVVPPWTAPSDGGGAATAPGVDSPLAGVDPAITGEPPEERLVGASARAAQ